MKRSCLLISLALSATPVQLLAAQQARATQDTPSSQRTQRPPLHGTHWVALTGKPLGAAAGAIIFQQGGNAIDAAARDHSMMRSSVSRYSFARGAAT